MGLGLPSGRGRGVLRIAPLRLRLPLHHRARLAAFSAVYGLHGLLCGPGWGGGPAAALRVAAFAAAVTLQAAILVALYLPRLAPRSPFVRRVSRATGWTGLVAAIWSLLPVLATTSCG